MSIIFLHYSRNRRVQKVRRMRKSYIGIHSCHYRRFPNSSSGTSITNAEPNSSLDIGIIDHWINWYFATSITNCYRNSYLPAKHSHPRLYLRVSLRHSKDRLIGNYPTRDRKRRRRTPGTPLSQAEATRTRNIQLHAGWRWRTGVSALFFHSQKVSKVAG